MRHALSLAMVMALAGPAVAPIAITASKESGGIRDPKTGRCVDRCMDDHYAQEVVIYPRPKQLAGYRQAYARVMPKSARKRAKRFTRAGLLHHKKKRWSKAAAAFSKAVGYWPDNVTFIVNLAGVRALQRKKGAALTLLERARALDAVKTRRKVAKDADFDGLRADPKFKALFGP